MIYHGKKTLTSQLTSFDYYYYRTHNGAEIDLILEGRFGLIPIKIKAGTAINRKQLTSLEQFVDEYGCPIGIIINNSLEPLFISQKIIQIPAVCL